MPMRLDFHLVHRNILVFSLLLLSLLDRLDTILYF